MTLIQENDPSSRGLGNRWMTFFANNASVAVGNACRIGSRHPQLENVLSAMCMLVSLLLTLLTSFCTDHPDPSSATGPLRAPHLAAREDSDFGTSSLTVTSSDEWISLFDGESLYGWKAESEADWRVEDGAIVVSEGDVGLLRTTSQFSEFELELEFQAAEDTNSGIFVLTSPQPTNPIVDCIEVNIAPPDNPFPTGSLVGRQRIAAGEEISGAGEANNQAKRWQHMHVRVAEGRIRVLINGAITCDYRETKPLQRGFIGLQVNSGEIRFRKIRLRPLFGSEHVRDLLTWAAQGDVETTSESGDGFRMQGGPGYVELPQSRFADFILQTKCRIAAGQNSGVFFRCVPNESQNGYEVQIDNSVEAGSNQPANAGTGAIFRRTTARAIVAKDETWFTLTLVVCGPHVSVWVDGVQVTDWTDTRPPDANPRRGKRLDGGTIQLQGHDSECDVMFRAMRIRELAPRNR